VTTPARNQVDLHSHTRRSDGIMEPRDLYDEAREYGMRLVAITDHDSLAAYRELRAAGIGASPGRDGPELLPGVEINTLAVAAHGGSATLRAAADELHVLGLGVDPDDGAFEDVLGGQRRRRRERIERMVRALGEAGVSLDGYLEQTLPATVSSAGRPHVARALVLAGYATSIEDAMVRWLVPGAPAWVAREGIDTRQAITAIRAAGGLPSLAHFPAAPERTDLLRELQEIGLGGLEVFYRSFDPATVSAMAETASALALVPTGGSDYHGDAMTYAEAQDLTRVPLAVGEAVLGAVGR
jgi:predicted metal-dependent phosphoesterase TrpH